ncbi:hypothetical protein [Paenibacillus brevis]|uniref:Uncharacterized protein n=1 Tax=Paenibacillus brevis TaxID=2841508 RepID=A0ABS6FU40_9BACL|nr:hypothetical protein [Paenibacillus brevis]MBU5672661.1 hypothetical protein [Paenibacillus brevis]
MRRGIKFKDGGYDTSRFGHPTIIPLDLGFGDSVAYFLSTTSQVEIYPQREQEYYLVNSTRNGFKKPSLINLKFIYKAPHGFSPPGIGCIKPEDFYKMIAKFVAYQEITPDEYYEELFPRIQGYLN